MGYYLSKFCYEEVDTSADKNHHQSKYHRYNGYTKQQIVDHVKITKPGALEIDDDFAKHVKDIDLVCTNLLAMNIEFYEKASVIVPKHKYEQTLKEMVTRDRFIAPRFGPEKIAGDASRANIDMSQFDDELVLSIKADPTFKMANGRITLNEFIESFKTPTNKKDLFGFSKKILASMPNFHKQRLVNIYNKLYSAETPIASASLGRASYLYKEAKKGPTDDLSSFRQIVSIPNSLNHYHRILSLRLNEYLLKNNFLNVTIQKGSINGIKNGVLEQIFKIKQIVKDANDNKKECAIMFLDISNAFGNLNLTKLFKIMTYYHIDQQFIDYVKSFYEGFEYYVQTKSWSTDLKKWEGGLIQGCPLSPTLFVLALDYVLNYLDEKYCDTHGYRLADDNRILLSAFVDDICIICNDMEKLQFMYKRVSFLLNSIGLPCNKLKCAYMSINPSDPTKLLEAVPPVKVYRYLGEYISIDGSSTESYKIFMGMLTKKLMSLDRKKIDEDTKLKFFSKCMLPWIQRKLMVMYDIGIEDKKQIVSVVKKYLIKWGSEEDIHIFTFIADMLLSSTDTVISKINITEEFDQNLKEEIELANTSFSNTNMSITYDQINKTPKVKRINEDQMKQIAHGGKSLIEDDDIEEEDLDHATDLMDGSSNQAPALDQVKTDVTLCDLPKVTAPESVVEPVYVTVVVHDEPVIESIIESMNESVNESVNAQDPFTDQVTINPVMQQSEDIEQNQDPTIVEQFIN
jgi:hypothetical protein